LLGFAAGSDRPERAPDVGVATATSATGTPSHPRTLDDGGEQPLDLVAGQLDHH
jgi:hypothetical protein